MNQLGDKFLSQCRINYYNGITPSNKAGFKEDEYLKLIEISKNYFENGKLLDFSSFFMESQFLVDLWAAHLILDYGKPSEIIKTSALEIIKKYSKTRLSKDLAQEEKDWLRENSLE